MFSIDFMRSRMRFGLFYKERYFLDANTSILHQKHCDTSTFQKLRNGCQYSAVREKESIILRQKGSHNFRYIFKTSCAELTQWI